MEKNSAAPAEIDPLYKLRNVNAAAGTADVVLHPRFIPAPCSPAFFGQKGAARVNAQGQLVEVLSYPSIGPSYGGGQGGSDSDAD